MHLVLGLVSIVATVIAVNAICNKISFPAPLALIAVGILGSFLPFIPEVELHPEVVLFGLLPPLLYSASLNTSLVDFNANRRPILTLSVGLVIATTFAVGAVVKWLVPDLPWWAALAIGAVVAPPDAVAATAIGRSIGLPRRVVTILEGESLLNDATALVALNTAIGAAAVASVNWGGVASDFVVAAGGGLVVGLVVFVVVAKIRRPLKDPLLDSGVSFVTPFAAYVIAEEIHILGAHPSGVISVVVAGLLLGHKAPILQTAQSRILESSNWRSIAFLLESAVFLLIGLQARNLFVDVARGDLGLGTVIWISLVVLAAVVAVRMIWVFVFGYVLVRLPRAGDARPALSSLSLVGWAGMRGVVTLAAAFIIPADAPHRDLLLLIAFVVTAGTLFGQGLTLPLLARWLRAPSPDPASDALARANLLQRASVTGLAKLSEINSDDPHQVEPQIRDRLERRNFAAWEAIGAKDEETPTEAYTRLRAEMIQAERDYVLEVRSTGTVPHEVLREVLALLDVEESMLDYSERERSKVKASLPSTLEGRCEHLREAHPGVEADSAGECTDCLRESTAWVHLRMCTTCGHIACCDSSVGRHASKHYAETGHPVMRSAEPGEDWRWCFVDELTG